eukprot:1154193-Pelagomonas_calceolata.AAC.5
MMQALKKEVHEPLAAGSNSSSSLSGSLLISFIFCLFAHCGTAPVIQAGRQNQKLTLEMLRAALQAASSSH